MLKAWGTQLCLSQWQFVVERFVATTRNLAEEKGEQKDEREPLRHVAQWSSERWPLVGRQKYRISGNRQRPKPTSWERTSSVSLEEDEKKEPVTKRRREYTDLWLHLGEREEQVACHASALAMTDKTCREAEM